MTVGGTGKTFVLPGPEACQADRVAGQARLYSRMFHPAVQRQVEHLQPRAEAGRAGLHTALQEKRETRAAFWKTDIGRTLRRSCCGSLTNMKWHLKHI